MGVAGLGVVGPGAAELLHRDVLAGDGLDDVGPGDEHVRGAVDHDREVGDRGGVDVPAGAGAHDHADLRDDARGVHVALEDLAVEAEGDHALLDPGAGALVDADDRAAGLDGEVHDLEDLLAVHLAERAAEDREVLGEHAHLAAVDGAVAGDHAVAVRAPLLEPEGRRAVPGQLVELDERPLVEELLDPLAGGHLALGVLLLDRPLGGRVHRLVQPPVQVGDLAGRGVDVDLVGSCGRLVRSRRVSVGGLAKRLWSSVRLVLVNAEATSRPPLDLGRLSAGSLAVGDGSRCSRRRRPRTPSSPTGLARGSRRGSSSSPSTRRPGGDASTGSG